MSNKETLQTYNTRLTTNNSSLSSILETINTLPEAGTNSGGTSINVFIQEDEPTTYDGIWVKTTNTASVVDITNTIEVDVNWEQSEYPLTIQEIGAASVGTDIYYVGGTVSGSATNNMYKYDTVNNTYTKLTNLPYSAYGIGVVSYGTDVYIFGGRNGSSAYNYAYKYDTINDTYTQLTSMGKNIGQIGAVIVDNYVYIIGGYVTGGSYSSTVYRYDILTDEYATMANLPSARNAPGVCAIGNYIYIGGGFNGNPLSHMYRYDIANNSYETLTNLPATGFGYALVAYSEYVFVIGGYSNTAAHSAVYRYNPSEDTYTETGSLVTGVGRIDGVAVDGKIYIAGGAASSAVTQNTMQIGLISSDYTNTEDTIVLEFSTNGKNVQLSSSGIMLNTKIINASYCSQSDGIDYTVNCYYGDGEKWNKY